MKAKLFLHNEVTSQGQVLLTRQYESTGLNSHEAVGTANATQGLGSVTALLME